MDLLKKVNNEESQGIVLKNIDLTGITKVEQKNKIQEELREFEEAICEHIVYPTEKTKNHAIEEYFDLLQSALGQLEKEGITAEEVMKEYPKHLKKLEKRPRKKECSKCIRKSKCKLYLSLSWQGEQEAERCTSYKEQEE